MIKILLKMEYRRAIKANLAWSLGVASMVFLIIVLYPLVKDIYAQIPDELMAIMAQFGGIPEDVLEYFATEGAMMLQLFGAIYAGLLGFNMIAVFEKDRLAEMMYTQGISKKMFFTSKWMILSLMIFQFAIINGIIGYAGFIIIGESFDLGNYLLFTLLNGVMYLHIAGLGMILALLTPQSVKSMVALLIPLPLYIVALVSTLTDHAFVKALKYISPFTFSDPVAILKNQDSFEYISFIVFSGLVIAGSIYGYFKYQKRISVS